jgi:hypothetical protein
MVLELFIVWQKLRQYNSQYFRHWCVFIIERMTRIVVEVIKLVVRHASSKKGIKDLVSKVNNY